MKKKWEVRYFVTAVASVPVYKAYSKTETYRQAAKDGWGTVSRDENNVLVCDEDYNPVIAQQRVQANFRRRGRTPADGLQGGFDGDAV